MNIYVSICLHIAGKTFIEAGQKIFRIEFIVKWCNTGKRNFKHIYEVLMIIYEINTRNKDRQDDEGRKYGDINIRHIRFLSLIR
jgi:hypothetical protein